MKHKDYQARSETIRCDAKEYTLGMWENKNIDKIIREAGKKDSPGNIIQRMFFFSGYLSLSTSRLSLRKFHREKQRRS